MKLLVLSLLVLSLSTRSFCWPILKQLAELAMFESQEIDEELDRMEMAVDRLNEELFFHQVPELDGVTDREEQGRLLFDEHMKGLFRTECGGRCDRDPNPTKQNELRETWLMTSATESDIEIIALCCDPFGAPHH